MFTSDQIESLIEYLQGTCKSFDEGLTEVLGVGVELEHLSEDNHNQIDHAIFRCEECSWWYERGEESTDDNGSEGVCYNCGTDEEDED